MSRAIGLQYKMDGAERLQRAFKNAAKAAQYPHDLLEDIGEHLLTSTRRNFEDQGAAAGGWAKRVDTSNTYSLLRSSRNRLFKAATVRGADGNVFEIGRNFVRVGVDPRVIKYAKIHQRGGVVRPKRGKYLVFKIGNRWAKKRSVTIPARPYAFVRKTDPSIIARKAGFWMQSQLKAGAVGR